MHAHRGLQHFLALRAESHANPQFAQPLAYRVGSHSEDARDRQHRAHDEQLAQNAIAA
jgi:hypothetical protein